MPAKSKTQQRAAGMALAAKRGNMKPSELQGAAKNMYDSMSKKELEDFSETKHKDLPEKKKTNESLLQVSESLDDFLKTLTPSKNK